MAQQAYVAGKRRLISSSGGNAGMAVAFAGQQLNMKVTVIVPSTTPQFARDKIATFGAIVEEHGCVWDESDKYARSLAESDPEAQYCHPFEHTDTWTGHSTLVPEIQEQCAAQGYDRPSCIVLSVGGGGLLCGISEGLLTHGWENVPIVTVETEGAASFHAAKEAQELVRLPGITSVAKSLGACQVSPQCLKCDASLNIHAMKISDEECVHAMKSFANDHRMLVEPACAAALCAVYEGRIPLKFNGKKSKADRGPVVVIVCGGNIVDLQAIRSYELQMEANKVASKKEALLAKRGAVEVFYAKFVDPLVDMLGFGFPPGPKFIPACYVINTFKAGTIAMCFTLMHQYDNWTKSAYVITALHGSYGIFWFMKHFMFPDTFFLQPITIMSAIFMGIVLSFYWSSAYLVITNPIKDNISNERMFCAIMMYVVGVVLMMGADTQKFFVLKLLREKNFGPHLIRDGWFGTCRNTNYLGEMLLYSSFAVCANNYIPWIFNVTFWSLMFVSRWMAKEASFRRKIGGAEYMARSSLIFPFPLWHGTVEADADKKNR
eukprot:Stramenopile-MAST_4_protein_4316